MKQKTDAEAVGIRKALKTGGLNTWCLVILAVLAFLRCGTSLRAQSPPIDGWFSTVQSSGDLYFFFSNPAKVERYHLASRSWLPVLNFPSVRGAATAASVDADGYYIAYGKSCYRYDLSGGNETFLLNTDYQVQAFHTDGKLLFINKSDSLYARFTSVNKDTNAVVANMENYIDALGGSSIAPSVHRLFGRSLGVSPSDITYVSYNDDGTFGQGGDSPAHGDYPSGDRTWVFPSGSRVVDNSGTVYGTSNLVYSASLGGSFDDVAFNVTDLPVVLRGKELTAYNAAMLPVGTVGLATAATRIFVDGSDVLAFRRDASLDHGIALATVSLSSLSAPKPGSLVDPRGLPFTPDEVWTGKDGVMLLLSKTMQSIFRWDPVTQEFGATIALLGSPDYGAYASETNTVYLAYTTGIIRKIDLGAVPLQEVPFAALPAQPRGLAAVGSYLMAGDASGAWMTHRTFSAEGVQISAKDWNYYSTEYIWSPQNQKLYFFRDDTSPNDLIWEQINASGTAYPDVPAGGLGTEMDSPYHGDFAVSHPIRLSKDGSRVIIGSGLVFDSTSLVKQTSGMSNSFVDGDWTSNGFWSIRDLTGTVQLQEWTGTNFAPGRVKQWSGVSKRCLVLPDNRLLVITAPPSGIPSFHIFDNSLSVVAPPALATPDVPVVSSLTASALTFTWPDITGESGYEVERRVLPANTWTLLSTTGLSQTSFQDGSVTAGQTYGYRITAVNNTLKSVPSAELQVTAGPPPAPGSFLASRVGTSSAVLLSWAKVGLATAYEIQWKNGSDSSWSALFTGQAADTQYTQNYLTPGVAYSFRVRATNAMGTGPWSAEAAFRLPAPVPLTPAWQTATAAATSITLRWGAVSYASEYAVEYRLKGTTAWAPVSTSPITGQQVVQNGLLPLTAYEYRIRSHSADGDSAWSATQTTTTLSLPAPAVPSLVSVSGGSSGTLVITWSNVTNETGYSLERQVDSGWQEIARLAADVTSYTDTGLHNGVTYNYRVRAFNATNSAYSTVLGAVPRQIAVIAADNFDDSPLPPWSEWSAGMVLKGKAGLKSGGALWFGLEGERFAETLPLGLSQGTVVEFAFRAGRQSVDGDEFWNDSEAGEDVVLEWSLDGYNWNVVLTIDPTLDANKTWRNFSVELPRAASSGETRLRWRQVANTGPDFDTWAIDDVVIKGTAPAVPSAPSFLLASATAEESTATATLYWQEVPGALMYDVERSVGGSAWSTVAAVAANDIYWIDTAASAGTAYSYRVRARNTAGTSGWSPSAYVRTLGAMQVWRASYLGAVEPSVSTGDFSPDEGGVPYILRFASKMAPGTSQRALDPARPEEGGLPKVTFDATRGCLTVSFLRPKAEVMPDMKSFAEFSSDGVTWTPVTQVDRTTSVDSVWEVVECHDPVPVGSAPMRFGRVRVTRSSN